MVSAPAVSAAKPWRGEMWMIFEPIVLMIFWPPAMVPRPMAAAHASDDPEGDVVARGGHHPRGSAWPAAA
jgi:hypothetical protein